jgi:hypothetical protein
MGSIDLLNLTMLDVSLPGHSVLVPNFSSVSRSPLDKG